LSSWPGYPIIATFGLLNIHLGQLQPRFFGKSKMVTFVTLFDDDYDGGKLCKIFSTATNI